MIQKMRFIRKYYRDYYYAYLALPRSVRKEIINLSTSSSLRDLLSLINERFCRHYEILTDVEFEIN
jgi:hypothetical protein